MDIADADQSPHAIAENYRLFATIEARPVSPLYEIWASAVAGDARVLELLATLPGSKCQPNLVFAAARWIGCPLDDGLCDWLLTHWDATREVALERSTQTNEAARCAVLLPLLTQIETRIDGPIALLEVGTSAGLCLYPDRYSYEYSTETGVVRIDPDDGPSSVVLPCTVSGDVDLPIRMPRVVWRGGIDIHPLDPSDSDQVDWLETLIWPGQEDRIPRLRAAAALAAAHPATIVTGDLVESLGDVAALAPAGATLVVFHSAVLAYLPLERRLDFEGAVRELDAVWLSNEGARVFPDIAARLPAGTHSDGRFVLSRDGSPYALTGPHGQSIARLPH